MEDTITMADKKTNKTKSSISTELQTKQLLHEMANFVALYETLEDKLITRETALEDKLLANETLLAKQLIQIKSAFAEFQAIMTEAGAARWRIAAENALREGQSHLQALEETSVNVAQSIKEGCEQLDQATAQTIAGITEATKVLPIKEFTQLIEQGNTQLKTTATATLEKTTDLIRWFHWKNLAMILALSVFVIFITGLYSNDEWPWEIHQQVVKERGAGRALIAAWPQLTPAEQQDIVNLAKINPMN